MEKFRTKVKQRMVVSSGIALVTLVLGAYSIYSIVFTDHSTASHSAGFMAGFQFGLIVSIFAFSLLDLVKLSRAIKDDTKLKVLYNKEHDERMKTIRSKAGMPLISLTSLLMIIAAIIAGYFNDVIFYTLVISVAAQLSVSAIVKLYCMKTM